MSFDAKEVLHGELFDEPGPAFTKRILCKLCGEVIFDLSEDRSPEAINRETKRLRIHLELRHGIETSSTVTSI